MVLLVGVQETLALRTQICVSRQGHFPHASLMNAFLPLTVSPFAIPLELLGASWTGLLFGSFFLIIAHLTTSLNPKKSSPFKPNSLI